MPKPKTIEKSPKGGAYSSSELSLLPCPFCGRKAKLWANEGDYCYVSCENKLCGKPTQLRNYSHCRYAIRAWNRRAR